MASQEDIQVRLPGEPTPNQFHDPRSAALYILTAYDIPLLEFLSWTLQERTFIINKPTAVTPNVWKFLLLQDQSLTQLKDKIESICSTTRGNKRGPSPPPRAGPMKAASPSENGENPISDDPTPPTTASIESQSAPFGVGFSQAPSRELAKLRHPRNTSKRQTTPAPARKRGSNRRIPEKENVTECPECGRKGQSIFDPSISDREGHVWQYFYCRNPMCAKGRSCNRYIGWAIRPLDR